MLMASHQLLASAQATHIFCPIVALSTRLATATDANT